MLLMGLLFLASNMIGLDSPVQSCFALNSESNTISFIELSEPIRAQEIQVGLGPKECTWDPENRLLYVSNTRGNTISSFNFATHELRHSAPIFDDPRGMALNSSKESLFVISKNTDCVIQLSTKDFSVSQVYQTGKGPRNIAIDPNDRFLFITNNEEGTLSIIDMFDPSLKIPFSLPICTNPYGIALDSKNQTLFITSIGENCVCVVNYENRSLERKIPVGKHPTKLVLNDKKLYVACMDENAIYSIDLQSNAIDQVIEVGNRPFGIDFNQQTNLLAVTCNGDHTIQFIDVENSKIINTLHIGEDPHSLTFLFCK